LERQVRY